jgi:8-oxo-dGTP pyrophosphatase MutT (NUDIX family)
MAKDKTAKNTTQSKKKTPPPPDPKRVCGTNEFLTDTLYVSTLIDGQEWNKAFKECIKKKSVQDAFTVLNKYADLLKIKPWARGEDDFVSKKLSVENRLHDVKVRAYLETKPKIKSFPTTAGVVVVFSDGKALYTQTLDGKYGFPKGKVEFELSDPTKIESAKPEDSVKAALRELEEEVGLHLSVDDAFLKTMSDASMDTYTPVYEDVHLKQVGTSGFLKVTGYNKKQISHGKENLWFYLVLYVEKGSTDIDLTKLTANAIQEKIKSYSYEQQQDKSKSFNEYSQRTFAFEKQPVKPKTPPKTKTKSKTPPAKQKTPESWENVAGGKRKTRKLRRRG